MTIDKTSQLEVGHEIHKVSLNCDESIVLWARPFLFSYSELHSALLLLFQFSHVRKIIKTTKNPVKRLENQLLL
jgi:hypothetical protein